MTYYQGNATTKIDCMSTGKTLPIADLPQDDPRVKQLNVKMKKEGYKPDALIEILHTAQNAFGYLPMNVLKYVGRELRLPPSRLFSTVTFYHFFSLKSKGKHTCLVCTGTACYVKGAQEILNKIEDTFHIKSGEVTPDENLGLGQARCIGACGLAPAVVLDDQVQAKVKPEEIINHINHKMGEQ